MPERERREWLREWTAELWYLLRRGERGRATEFCCGSFRDALVVRGQIAGAVQSRNLLHLSSPGACLAMLAIQASSATLIMWLSPAVRASVWQRPIEAHILIAAGALLLYPIVPGARGFDARGTRGWCFMAAKSVILIITVFFASFDIVPLLSRGPMQPQLAFVMYILAYWWAMNDQRRRCPTCLRLLTNPVQIGHPAGSLLEWYGTELMCPRGHGVLHEPGLSTSSYCTRRWVRLDASWQELFQ
jgi:hypothetical protein